MAAGVTSGLRQWRLCDGKKREGETTDIPGNMLSWVFVNYTE